MKLAIRIFAFAVVVAGAAAASFSSPASASRIVSHQSASAALPVPTCGPGMCPADRNNGLR